MYYLKPFGLDLLKLPARKWVRVFIFLSNVYKIGINLIRAV